MSRDPTGRGARHRPDPRAVAGAVLDPELPVLTLADLGVLRDVSTDGERVTVTITPTYSGCPALATMRAQLRAVLHAAGWTEVDVRTELDPPWSTDLITERGRRALAEHGIAPPGPASRHTGPIPLSLTRAPAAVPCPRCGGPSEETSQFGPTACTSLRRCTACAEPFESVKPL